MSEAGDPNKKASANVSSGDDAGDAEQAAFEDLYHRRGEDALRYATAILGVDDARDATQDAWLRVWRKRCGMVRHPSLRRSAAVRRSLPLVWLISRPRCSQPCTWHICTGWREISTRPEGCIARQD